MAPRPGRPQVFLSPHPDDAVWSCGGRLARQVRDGLDVAVVTVFDGDAPVPRSLGGWRRMAEPAGRRRENADALARLGVRGVSWGLTDAALRACGGRPLYRSPRSLLEAVHPEDVALLDALAARVRALADDADLHVPLACDTHVDHRLVREAVARAAPRSILFYEEFPYYAQPRPPDGLAPVFRAADPDAWIDAALCYKSQVHALFEDAAAFRDALLARVADHARAAAQARAPAAAGGYAERVWRSTAST